MLKKGFCILLILLIVLLLSGCYQECEGLKCTIYSGKKPEITKPYSKETMLELIDNLDCNGHLDIYDYDKFGVIGYTKINPNAKEPIINCNLKNNYIFDDEVSYKDQNGDEVRKITLLLKKYNIYFEIITKWGCISDDRYGVFGCSESGYIITTNYFSKILNYLQNQYDSQANSKICSFWNKNVCYVTSEADIAEVATYYEGLKEYLNNLHLDINFQKLHIHYMPILVIH